MNIEGIFDALHSNIKSSPNDIMKHIEVAKKDIQNYLNKTNFDMYSDIIEKMTPIELDSEDEENYIPK